MRPNGVELFEGADLLFHPASEEGLKEVQENMGASNTQKLYPYKYFALFSSNGLRLDELDRSNYPSEGI